MLGEVYGVKNIFLKCVQGARFSAFSAFDKRMQNSKIQLQQFSEMYETIYKRPVVSVVPEDPNFSLETLFGVVLDLLDSGLTKVAAKMFNEVCEGNLVLDVAAMYSALSHAPTIPLEWSCKAGELETLPEQNFF